MTPNRVHALSEFGGYSLKCEGHTTSDVLFGYRMFKSTKELTEAYERLYLDEVLPAVEKGLSASVYTQVSDMEDEVNGVFTFDRAKMKLEPETVRNLNDLLKSAGNAKCGSD